MEKRLCAGGCGEEIPAGPRTYKWGHKGGCNKRKSSPPPSKKGAKPEPEVIEEVEEEVVECQMTVPQIDAIYNLLTPVQKAIAVLSGLNEEA